MYNGARRKIKYHNIRGSNHMVDESKRRGALLKRFASLDQRVQNALKSGDADNVRNYILEYDRLIRQAALEFNDREFMIMHAQMQVDIKDYWPKHPERLLKALADSILRSYSIIGFSSVHEPSHPEESDWGKYVITTGGVEESPERSRKIFVVHGRNQQARKAMFSFLRSIGLQPIEWSEAINLTKKATPYVGEILDAAFSYAQAILVLFTGDDLARLGFKFRDEREPKEKLAPQARPNVIFESGLAFGKNPDKTILVQLGDLRPMSDIAGRYIVKIDNTPEQRNLLINRLESAGCSVQTKGRNDWMTEGDFDAALMSPD
jgi:hypothetical protein